MLAYERQAISKGCKFICGIDEAGRGPLAGPVVASACILPDQVYSDPLIFSGLNDSKLLTPQARERLYGLLTGYPGLKYAIGMATHAEIDSVNIYQASILAMKRAVMGLDLTPDMLLVDGLSLSFEKIPAQKLIKGDRVSLSIAAASVIAKRTRDYIMADCHVKWPEYGFLSHKGYATKVHLNALKEYGPCPIHRVSFAPIRDRMHLCGT